MIDTGLEAFFVSYFGSIMLFYFAVIIFFAVIFLLLGVELQYVLVIMTPAIYTLATVGVLPTWLVIIGAVVSTLVVFQFIRYMSGS